MSLLLEALKKAERAKEEAERRAKGGEAPEAPPDPDATVVDRGRHVMTKDELPDISAPHEILSEDIRPGAASTPLSLVDEAPPPPPEPKAPRREPGRESARDSARAAAPAPAAGATDRAAAQKVFEAKFKEPNPRLPFFIAMGALAAFAVGVVIYFWIQLRPAPSLVNANPTRPSDEKAVEVAAKPAAGAPAGPPAPPGAPELPGLPGTPPATPSSSAPAAPAAA